MTVKQTFYISVTDNIIETKLIPGRVELEIHATRDEIKELKEYMKNNGELEEHAGLDNSKELDKNIKVKPNNFNEMIDFIYQLGTPDTKKALAKYRN